MTSESIQQMIRDHLIPWYEMHHRRLPWRQTQDPYAIWVSEVMLQQTQVQTVLPYYQRFLETFPNVGALAEATQQDVLKLWEGLGYYARARNLHRAARMVITQHDGQIPADWKAFRKLPGVGDYIGAAVLSFAFDLPYAVVDGNVKRVLARLYCVDNPVNHSASHGLFRNLATGLLNVDAPGLHNQAMMELGALVCKPATPHCDACPVQQGCAVHQQGKLDQFPKRVSKTAVPVHHLVAAVVWWRNRVLIVKRPIDGLLGGLWEFPAGRVQPDEPGFDACARIVNQQAGIQIRKVVFVKTVKHAYSHFRVVMDVYRCVGRSGRIHLNGPIDFQWVRMTDLDKFPFTGISRKCMAFVMDAPHPMKD